MIKPSFDFYGEILLPSDVTYENFGSSSLRPLSAPRHLSLPLSRLLLFPIFIGMPTSERESLSSLEFAISFLPASRIFPFSSLYIIREEFFGERIIE